MKYEKKYRNSFFTAFIILSLITIDNCEEEETHCEIIEKWTHYIDTGEVVKEWINEEGEFHYLNSDYKRRDLRNSCDPGGDLFSQSNKGDVQRFPDGGFKGYFLKELYNKALNNKRPKNPELCNHYVFDGKLNFIFEEKIVIFFYSSLHTKGEYFQEGKECYNKRSILN